MSGEVRMVRGALLWSGIAALPAAGIMWAVRGPDGAISLLLAVAIVAANTAASAALSALAGKVSTMAAAFVSMPSFAFRMMGILAVLAVLKGQRFIDKPVFALAFGLAVTLVLVLEARSWSRTPWIGMTLKEKA